MIKILICDDEGIVRDSLTYIIQQNFAARAVTETARGGRLAIELADSFKPDIILMDIQMPGINGLEAMQEIRRENPHTIFIVLSAYDKFEYSQSAIAVGVFAYLTKPINRDVLCDVIRGAIRKVEERQQKVSADLKVKEKLEAVIPIIENGFVYSVLLEQNTAPSEELGYRELLGIEEDHGYVIVLECGEERQRGALGSSVGAGIKLRRHLLAFRQLVKETFPAIIGEIMGHRVILLIRSEGSAEEYRERLVKIDTTRALLRKLEQQTGLKFKAGIGTVRSWEQMHESYREAGETVHQGSSQVTHARDLPVSCVYEETYPHELEQQLFAAVERGEVSQTRAHAEAFGQWMESAEPRLNNTVRLKTIEFILWAERLAYMQGGMVYRFDNRREYLDYLLALSSYEELKNWFVKKMGEAAYHIEIRQQEKERSVIDRAKAYIEANYKRDLSLDTLAQEIAISPYYLSRLFKAVEGVNYIDYVTNLKINYAKTCLAESDRSVKEICLESGYSDPNYFSRMFKKWTGYTPTEFRERRVSL